MDVLVYSGRGTSAEAVRHTVASLKAALGGRYDVKTVARGSTFSDEPWEATCALLVIPGGRDMPYTEDISPAGLARIRSHVTAGGGRLIGLCAGAYFSCDSIAFIPEEGSSAAPIVAPRHLKLCPATAIGPIYSSFAYNSEAGAHAIPVVLSPGSLSMAAAPPSSAEAPIIHCYYNGGCYFDFGAASQEVAPHAATRGEQARGPLTFVTVASYLDDGCTDGMPVRAARPAIVAGFLPSSPAGQQASVVLSGVHLEYDAALITAAEDAANLDVPLLVASNARRLDLWRHLLATLGLSLAEGAATPGLSTAGSDALEAVDQEAVHLVLYAANAAPSNCQAIAAALAKGAPSSSACSAQKGTVGFERDTFAIRVAPSCPCEGPNAQAATPGRGTIPLTILSDWQDSPRATRGIGQAFDPGAYFAHLPATYKGELGRHVIYTDQIGSTQTTLVQ